MKGFFSPWSDSKRILDYGFAIWGPSLSEILNSLSKVSKRKHLSNKLNSNEKKLRKKQGPLFSINFGM